MFSTIFKSYVFDHSNWTHQNPSHKEIYFNIRGGGHSKQEENKKKQPMSVLGFGCLCVTKQKQTTHVEIICYISPSVIKLSVIC